MQVITTWPYDFPLETIGWIKDPLSLTVMHCELFIMKCVNEPGALDGVYSNRGLRSANIISSYFNTVH